MAASGWFLVKMTTTTTQRANASYAQAASVAYTTASSIRTILSLNAVNTMIENFMAATAQAYNDATSQVAWLGVANGCMMGSFLLASIAVPLYGGSLLWKQIEESRCDPSGTVTDNASCDPSGMDVFGAMFGIFLAAAVLPQLTTIQESITNARVACYLAQETMNRKLDDDEIGPTEGDAQETTKTTAADSNRPRDKIRRGHSKLPEYKIDCMSPRGLRPKKLKGEIEFSKVTFAYPTRQETNVLDQFSLKIEAGKSIAICGCSGSGKSTIVQLLERNYDVQAGSIKIDSHDIRDLNVKWLRSHIGLVQQEPKLFGTSIAENIRYGNPEATIEEIEDACKAANAHAFIESFPDGYNTQVGDMGGKLSGGQKVRQHRMGCCVDNFAISFNAYILV
jgi:ATP-binding cassette subfamily B (MDR/TAP) protein 1